MLWSKLFRRHRQVVEDTLSGDLWEQTCQLVDLYRDLLPFYEDQNRIFGELVSGPQAHVLKPYFFKCKRLCETGVNVLKLSSDQIRGLNQQACGQVLRQMKIFAPVIRVMVPLTGIQPFLKCQIELCHSPSLSGEEVFMDDLHDHLYIEKRYLTTYFGVLYEGRSRLKDLVSKDNVPSARLLSLKTVLEKCMNLLQLQRADIPRVNRQECRRLVKMIKLFVMGALIRNFARGDMKQVWPAENLIAISELLQQLNLTSESDRVGSSSKVRAESSDYQCAPQGSHSSEGDWDHHAYKELLTTRRMHSLKLDEAYKKDYGGVMCDMLARTADKFLKKSLEFLSTSRAEVVCLSKEKCYYRMMLIKLFVLLTEGPVSANQKSVQPQEVGSLLNNRDWLYEEVRGIRQKYSSVLDKRAHRKRRPERTQAPRLVKKKPKAWSNRDLEQSLAFVGLGRADIAKMSVAECYSMLRCSMRYLKCSSKYQSVHAYDKSLESFSESTCGIWPESSPYWRDEVYEEIKSKKTKFLYEFDVPRKEVHKLIQLAAEASKGKELLDRASRFFAMKRFEIAVLSERGYDELVVSVNQDLVNVMGILSSLQKNIGKKAGYPCDITRILLERRIVPEDVARVDVSN